MLTLDVLEILQFLNLNDLDEKKKKLIPCFILHDADKPYLSLKLPPKNTKATMEIFDLTTCTVEFENIQHQVTPSGFVVDFFGQILDGLVAQFQTCEGVEIRVFVNNQFEFFKQVYIHPPMITRSRIELETYRFEPILTPLLRISPREAYTLLNKEKT